MIFGPNYGYEAIQSVSKKKSANTRIIAYSIISIILTTLSIYFLYSGYYGLSTPLSRLLGPRSPKTNIRIEYYMDDLTEPIQPGTTAWTAFHDELIEEAGYNPNDLRKNPYATVTFVAYDADEEDLNPEAHKKTTKSGKKSKSKSKSKTKTKKKKGKSSAASSSSSDQQDRPTYGITCYTEYNDIGSVNSKMCQPTSKILSPIRTGCSSLADGYQLMGVSAENELECTSNGENERVSARCCQPTPNTDYEDSAWTMSTSGMEHYEAKCLTVKCRDGDVLTGCSGSQSEESAFGGAEMSDDGCSVQRNGNDGSLVVEGMCATQPSTKYDLQCSTMIGEDAELNEDGQYVSSAQCSGSLVMFDCSSFIGNGRMDQCDNSMLEQNVFNEDVLFGEYYYRETLQSKVVCKAVGNSENVKAQATCCKLV